MAIIDEVKRRARRAGFEAERVVRVNRVQSRIVALQGELSSGITRLGYLTYDLAGRGELEQPQLRQFCAQLDGIRAQITAAEAEIHAIQTEPFVEEPSHIACPSCGATCPAQAHFCQGCGAPLAQAAPPAPATITCRACGAGNPLDMRFCNQCGQPLAGSGAIASQDAPTVLVASPPAAAAPGTAIPVPIAPAAVPPPVPASPAPVPNAPADPGSMPGAAAALTAPVATASAPTHADPPPSPDLPDQAGAPGGEPEPGGVPPSAPAGAAGAGSPGAATLPSPHEDQATLTGDPHDEPRTAQPPAGSAAAGENPAVERRCAACGETVPGGARFCVGCGQPVAPSR